MNNIILFENYILDRMTDDAKAQFEASLQHNPVLAEDFREFQLVYVGFAKSERKQLLEITQQLEAQYQSGELDENPKESLIGAGIRSAERRELVQTVQKLENKPAIQRRLAPPWIWRTAAASVAIIAIVGAGFYLTNRQQSNKLFDDHFTNYDHAFIKRSSSNDQLISEAYSLYDNNEYKKAINALEKLSDNPLHKLYLGISYLGAKKSTEAKRIFDDLDSSLPSHKNVIRWYYALAELQQGDTTSMIQNLEQIEYDSYWLGKRNELLDKVK